MRSCLAATTAKAAKKVTQEVFRDGLIKTREMCRDVINRKNNIKSNEVNCPTMATYFDSGQHHFRVFVKRQRLFRFIVAIFRSTAK